MPELPEVETIRRQLEKELTGGKIKEVIIKDERLIKEITPQKFTSQIEGKTVQKVIRRGKMLIIKLDEKLFLVLHLRISGWLMLSKREEDFFRVGFKFGDNKILQFCDSRVLGEIKLVEDWQKLSIVERMGPEPLEINKNDFMNLFSGKTTKIKPLLMDQNFLAGIGNIYAQEALFCAKIHPERNADKTDKNELIKLHGCLIKILKKSIECKGSSADTYRQIDGQSGSFCDFHNVYQRENQPCKVCKAPIKKKDIAGRGTCFCPNCQK